MKERITTRFARARNAAVMQAGERNVYNFVTERGLEGQNGALEVLPTFAGLNLIEIIDGMIDSGGSPVRVLDVGCGSGNVLLNLSEKYEDKVRLFGVNSYPYHLESEEKAKKLKEKNIDIRVAGMTMLGKEFPPNSIDVAIAIQSVYYSWNNWLAVKHIHKALRMGGIALIDYMFADHNIIADNDEIEALVDYLSKVHDMEFVKKHPNSPRISGVSLSFEKKHPNLALPLKLYSFTGRKPDGTNLVLDKSILMT